MKYWITLVAMAAAMSFAIGCQKSDSGSEAASAPAETAASESAEGFTAVDSSLVGGVKYDGGSSTLTVQLNDGKVYEYDGVGQDVFDGFMASDSKGSYFAKEIKGKFEGHQM